MEVVVYQHGIFPRSEELVTATRDFDRGRTTASLVDEQFTQDAESFVSLQRDAGLHYFSDGLLRWQDIFRPFVEACSGLQPGPLTRWFDNNSFFRAPEANGDLHLRSPALPEFADMTRAFRPRVATLPSPYMFSRAAHRASDRNALMVQFVHEVLRPVAQSLVSGGVELIHLQEPWLAFFGPDRAEWDAFEGALADLRQGIGALVVLHTYFGDVGSFLDRLGGIPVDAVGIDVLETDLDSLPDRWDKGLLVGCIDGRSSVVESVEEIVEFAARVADRVQPATLYLSSNSDLDLLPCEVARHKVRLLGEAARALKESLA